MTAAQVKPATVTANQKTRSNMDPWLNELNVDECFLIVSIRISIITPARPVGEPVDAAALAVIGQSASKHTPYSHFMHGYMHSLTATSTCCVSVCLFPILEIVTYNTCIRIIGKRAIEKLAAIDIKSNS